MPAILCKLIPLKLSSTLGSPFFRIGTSSDRFQSSGALPVCQIIVMMRWSQVVVALPPYFSISGIMRHTPAALQFLRQSSAARTRSTVGGGGAVLLGRSAKTGSSSQTDGSICRLQFSKCISQSCTLNRAGARGTITLQLAPFPRGFTSNYSSLS